MMCVRDDTGCNLGRKSGCREKFSDYENTLRVKPIGFADRLSARRITPAFRGAAIN